MEIQQVLPMAINVRSILKSMSAIIKELRRANSWPLTCSARGHQYHAPVLEELRKNLLHSCPILSNFDHISLFLMVRQDKTTGWWFGTWFLWLSILIGNVIILTDFHSIIFRGVAIPTTNQTNVKRWFRYVPSLDLFHPNESIRSMNLNHQLSSIEMAIFLETHLC